MSAQSEVASARPRGPGRSFTGLLWSLVPILVVVVLLVLWQRGSASPVLTVDPGPDVAYAQRISPVPLPAPGPLPGTWRSTSSDVDAPNADPTQPDQPRRSPVTLTIGYLTEDDHFAEVVVGDRPATALLDQAEPGATRDGDVVIGTGRWDTYRNQRGEQVLAGTVGRAGVLVTGDASGTDLAALAAAVRLP
ncbi:MAG TPA: DUF4245 family protein [Mycobacteriales bacterium]|nr:DUF4245 family protein [Mycobacteriales bacterium]